MEMKFAWLGILGNAYSHLPCFTDQETQAKNGEVQGPTMCVAIPDLVLEPCAPESLPNIPPPHELAAQAHLGTPDAHALDGPRRIWARPPDGSPGQERGHGPHRTETL